MSAVPLTRDQLWTVSSRTIVYAAIGAALYAVLGLFNFTLPGTQNVSIRPAYALVPFFGHLSDRIGRKRVYITGAVLTGLWALPYFGLLNTGDSTIVFLAIAVSLIPHNMQYGPQAALIAESFGTNLRYSGAGLGYQLASVIAGGPAPLIAAAILSHTGSSTWISIYIIACCAFAAVALWLMPRRTESAPIVAVRSNVSTVAAAVSAP
mgnify:CR=1 FL=1